MYPVVIVVIVPELIVKPATLACVATIVVLVIVHRNGCITVPSNWSMNNGVWSIDPTLPKRSTLIGSIVESFLPITTTPDVLAGSAPAKTTADMPVESYKVDRAALLVVSTVKISVDAPD